MLKVMLSYLNLLFFKILYQIVFYSNVSENYCFLGRVSYGFHCNVLSWFWLG